MKIGFVFTNYNSSELTIKSIESIQKFSNENIKIVIVDNASDNDELQKLTTIISRHNNIHTITNTENVGYFNGLNIGIQYLRKHNNYEYLVIGNNDILFPENFLETLYNNKFLFDKYPVISPNIITLDGVHQNPHVVDKISTMREIIYDIYHLNYYLSIIIALIARYTKNFTDRRDEEQHEIAQEIYQGYGALYILGPKFFQNFDKLWAPTFLMHEEFFLSKQLSDKGYRIYYEPSIVVTHLAHSTTSKIPSKIKWELSRKAHKEYRKYVKLFY